MVVRHQAVNRAIGCAEESMQRPMFRPLRTQVERPGHTKLPLSGYRSRLCSRHETHHEQDFLRDSSPSLGGVAMLSKTAFIHCGQSLASQVRLMASAKGTTDDHKNRSVQAAIPRSKESEVIAPLRLYVDGSYRVLANEDEVPMAAGIYAAAGGKTVSIDLRLAGGKPGSTRAEYGALYAALIMLCGGGPSGGVGMELQVLAQDRKRVKILSDNLSCVMVLEGLAKPSSSNKDKGLIKAIKVLSTNIAQQIRLELEHADVKRNKEHADGIAQAHKLAYKCTSRLTCGLPA